MSVIVESLEHDQLRADVERAVHGLDAIAEGRAYSTVVPVDGLGTTAPVTAQTLEQGYVHMLVTFGEQYPDVFGVDS